MNPFEFIIEGLFTTLFEGFFELAAALFGPRRTLVLVSALALVLAGVGIYLFYRL